MHTIICYGDSNTWGYKPPNDRYEPEERWTGVLEKNDFTVINEGMPGRMIPVDPLLMEHLAAKMSGYDAPDVFLIMLGGNNILNEEGAAPKDVADKMDAFLSSLPAITWFDPAKTLLISPVKLKPGSWVWDEEMIESSMQLGPLYADVAAKHGMKYLDASCLDIDKVSDGVHYTAAGHKALGETIYAFIKENMI